MTKGIYKYKDLVKNIDVYIGKDSKIHYNQRHSDHKCKSNYKAQKINQIIQNNPERYEYSIICEYPNLTDEELSYLEIKEIMKHKFLYGKIPKFNFTIGGDGSTGYKKETKEEYKYKIRTHGDRFAIDGYDPRKPIKTSIYYDELIPICEALNNNEITEQEVKEIDLYEKRCKYYVLKNKRYNTYTIYRRKQYIKSFKTQQEAKDICDKLNADKISEEEVKNMNKETKAYISKSGKYFVIRFKGKAIRQNKDINKLIPLCDALNNNQMAVDEVKNYDLFEYTVVFNGDHVGFSIHDRNHKKVKSSRKYDKLVLICNALNSGELSEEQVKSVHGVNKLIKMVN